MARQPCIKMQAGLVSHGYTPVGPDAADTLVGPLTGTSTVQTFLQKTHQY
jgi:hypothetical protein